MRSRSLGKLLQRHRSNTLKREPIQENLEDFDVSSGGGGKRPSARAVGTRWRWRVMRGVEGEGEMAICRVEGEGEAPAQGGG